MRGGCLVHERLLKEGWVLADAFLASEECRRITSQLLPVMVSNATRVAEDGINILTVNGPRLIEAVSELSDLYDRVLGNLRLLIPSLQKLDDLEVGLSANCMMASQQHSFRRHFDRHEVTAILYLTENADYPLEFFPQIRTDPADGPVKWLYETASRIPLRIHPTPGRLVCFFGRTCLHGVSSVGGAESGARLSIQFGYDSRFKIFPNQTYYGRGSRP